MTHEAKVTHADTDELSRMGTARKSVFEKFTLPNLRGNFGV